MDPLSGADRSTCTLDVTFCEGIHAVIRPSRYILYFCAESTNIQCLAGATRCWPGDLYNYRRQLVGRGRGPLVGNTAQEERYRWLEGWQQH